MNAVRGWMSVVLLALSPWAGSLAQWGSDPTAKTEAPSLIAWLNYQEGGLFLHASGRPGAEAWLHVRVQETSPTEVQGAPAAAAIPIRFDAAGVWYDILPLAAATSETPREIVFWISDAGASPAQDLVSTEWKLETGCVAANTPGLENPPIGGLEMRPHVGSTSPVFPASWAVLAAPGLLLEGMPHHFALSLAPTGIEGVLPVN